MYSQHGIPNSHKNDQPFGAPENPRPYGRGVSVVTFSADTIKRTIDIPYRVWNEP